MRDYALFVVLALALLFAVARPLWGVAIWSWLSYMSPHRLAYGVIRDLPVVQPAVAVTFIALFFNWKDRMRWRWTPVTVAWAALITWFVSMSLFALYPEQATFDLDRTIKIQLMILATYFIVRDRRAIDLMVWTIALSIGFYGFKGGIFTLATGGSYLVWGPSGTFIEDNNAMALALTIVLPLLWYLRGQAANKWVSRALLLGFVLCLVSVLGSYSRGAYLAICAVLGAMWWRSNQRVLGAGLVAVAVIAAFGLMPEKFTTRVDSISNYTEDASAQGRINAWGFAVNVAMEHPIKGGGYGVFNADAFQRFAPEPDRFHDAHSIYFEVLGEQGFVGLALFLLFAFLAFMETQRIRKATRDDPEKKWAFDLATALQASAIAYGVGGAFLGLAYFDLPYQLVALVVLTGRIALPDAKEVELSKPALTAAERRRLRTA